MHRGELDRIVERAGREFSPGRRGEIGDREREHYRYDAPKCGFSRRDDDDDDYDDRRGDDRRRWRMAWRSI